MRPSTKGVWQPQTLETPALKCLLGSRHQAKLKLGFASKTCAFSTQYEIKPDNSSTRLHGQLQNILFALCLFAALQYIYYPKFVVRQRTSVCLALGLSLALHATFVHYLHSRTTTPPINASQIPVPFVSSISRALVLHLSIHSVSTTALLVSARQQLMVFNRRCALSRPCRNVLAIFVALSRQTYMHVRSLIAADLWLWP